MKRITLIIRSLLFLTTLFPGCGEGKGKGNDKGVVELTTAAQEVKIYTSSGAMTIDWGDGQTDSYTSTDETKISHAYADNSSHTVRMDVDSLTLLWCFHNQLTALDVSRNTALTVLVCFNNQLTALDVSKNKALTMLVCFDNQLTALNVSLNTALTKLSCGSNQLTALDVSRNMALMELTCADNQLTALDVCRNTALTVLWCNNNQLTALDVSKNTALTELWCNSNQLTTEALNALFSGLPAPSDGTILIGENPGSSTCNRSIATEKGWTFEE